MAPPGGGRGVIWARLLWLLALGALLAAASPLADAASSTGRGPDRAWPADLFRDHDRDGDGLLDAAEFGGYLAAAAAGAGAGEDGGVPAGVFGRAKAGWKYAMGRVVSTVEGEPPPPPPARNGFAQCAAG